MGIGRSEITNLASFTGCLAESFPFVYLGVPIGESLVHVKGWKIIIDHFKKRLASWKARLLSIGVRLSLVKSVLGSLGIYYFSIFKVPTSIIDLLKMPFGQAQVFFHPYGERYGIQAVRRADI